MIRYDLLFVAVGTALLAGCASVDKQAAVEDDDKTYVTGSRIPVRTGTGNAASVSKTGIDDMMRKRDIAPGMPGS